MEKIIVKDKVHLHATINEHIIKYGHQCNLNHIDVSNIRDMSSLFCDSLFNGDISQWDVSNVKNMSNMFAFSNFKGDISKWNVSNVDTMESMFEGSKFRNDISTWDFNKHCNFNNMFYCGYYPKNGCLFWYLASNREITLNTSEKQHLKHITPILENLQLDGIEAAKYLHQTYIEAHIFKIDNVENTFN